MKDASDGPVLRRENQLHASGGVYMRAPTFSDLPDSNDVQWKHDKDFCQLMILIYRGLRGFTLQLLHLAERPASGVRQTLGYFGGFSLQAGFNLRFAVFSFILSHSSMLVRPIVLSFSGSTHGGLWAARFSIM